MNKTPVAIIGATGTVGRRFAALLADHPWFDAVAVAASAASAGKTYAEATRGRGTPAPPPPPRFAGMTVLNAEEEVATVAARAAAAFVATDLDKERTRALEEAYAAAGVAVVSTNSAHRWTADVPILLPEVNADHVRLLDAQRKARGWGRGFIVVKPNCSVQSYLPVVKAWEAFEPTRVAVTTLQAVSGAGRTLASWPEMEDNVIPFIAGEEEKSEREPLKILGVVEGARIRPAGRPTFSATCLRVPVSDGHLASASVEFDVAVGRDDLRAALADFANPLADLGLPSAPERFLHYCEEEDRPQLRRDRDRGGGMTVSVGRLRADGPHGWKFVALSHNTIRGAAGGAVLTAELLKARGYIP